MNMNKYKAYPLVKNDQGKVTIDLFAEPTHLKAKTDDEAKAKMGENFYIERNYR